MLLVTVTNYLQMVTSLLLATSLLFHIAPVLF